MICATESIGQVHGPWLVHQWIGYLEYFLYGWAVGTSADSNAVETFVLQILAEQSRPPNTAKRCGVLKSIIEWKICIVAVMKNSFSQITPPLVHESSTHLMKCDIVSWNIGHFMSGIMFHEFHYNFAKNTLPLSPPAVVFSSSSSFLLTEPPASNAIPLSTIDPPRLGAFQHQHTREIPAQSRYSTRRMGGVP